MSLNTAIVNIHAADATPEAHVSIKRLGSHGGEVYPSRLGSRMDPVKAYGPGGGEPYLSRLGRGMDPVKEKRLT